MKSVIGTTYYVRPSGFDPLYEYTWSYTVYPPVRYTPRAGPTGVHIAGGVYLRVVGIRVGRLYDPGKVSLEHLMLPWYYPSLSRMLT